MAIGRRFFDQIDYILSTDPALDPESSHEKFLEDLDSKHLKVKEGEQPTVFRLKQLDYEQLRHLQTYPEGSDTRVIYIIRAGLLDVDNYLIERNGKEEPLRTPDRKKEGSAGVLVSKRWMSEAGFPESVLAELSIVISILSQADIKK